MSRSLKRWLVGLAAFASFVGLVVLASLPTGADEATGVVPDGVRLVTSVDVDDAVVLLLSEGGRLRVQVAYQSPKGWLDVLLSSRDADVVAARASTPGSGPVPPLTVVYGRVPGEQVRVRWDDGTSTEAQTSTDGIYLVARSGVAGVELVSVVDADDVVLEVTEI